MFFGTLEGATGGRGSATYGANEAVREIVRAHGGEALWRGADREVMA